MKDRLIATYKDKRGVDAARRGLLHSLYENKYGVMPPKPEHLRASLENRDMSFAAGRGRVDKVMLTVTVDGREFSFPIHVVIPNGNTALPTFIHISHFDGVIDKFSPAEEIIDNGFALISFAPDVILPKLKRHLGITRRALNSCGDISLSAWLALRVLEYAVTIPEVDAERCAVIGHGHLGAAAMLAGAECERIKYVISNSCGIEGCELEVGNRNGAARLKCEHAELFCRRYAKRPGVCEGSDAHILASLIAPRHLIITTATDDPGLDFQSAFSAAKIAGEIYESIYGAECGFDKIDDKYSATFKCGKVAFHERGGCAYLSRRDWGVYMNYIKQNG